MNYDCAFYIGTTHDVCQDYALSGRGGVVISDGCSGSNLSDMGSRVLSITAINKLSELSSLYDFDAKECVLLARPSTKILGLPDTCLDATLFMAKYSKKQIGAVSYGDGVIAIKKGDGIITICTEYTDSYPFYPNYLYDMNNRYDLWKTNHNQRKVSIASINIDGEIKEVGEINEYFRITQKDNTLIGISPECTRVYIDCPNSNKIEWVAIMSDGVQSFYETIETNTSRNNKPVPYLDILKELLAFKNFKGSFVQRRINKFRKVCKKKNWHNADDVSLATIHIVD